MDKEFAALAAKLHEIGGPVMRQAQRKGLRLVGNIMVAAISERAPSKKGRGGLLAKDELKNSFKAKVHIASDDAITQGDTSRVSIGPSSHEAQLVANWVENGHATRKPGSGRRSRRHAKQYVDAKPFVRPAFDSKKDEAVAAYTASVAEDIQKAMK